MATTETIHRPWNYGQIIGPKPPLKPKHIWAIRTRLQHEKRTRDLALFNLALDSKLRGCDLVRLRVSDVFLGSSVRLRTTIVQQKTGRPVPFELSETTRETLMAWLQRRQLRGSDWLFPSRSRPVAAAVVALSRFISASNPSLGPYLASAIDGAEKAGLSPADLQLLKMLVASLT